MCQCFCQWQLKRSSSNPPLRLPAFRSHGQALRSPAWLPRLSAGNQVLGCLTSFSRAQPRTPRACTPFGLDSPRRMCVLVSQNGLLFFVQSPRRIPIARCIRTHTHTSGLCGLVIGLRRQYTRTLCKRFCPASCHPKQRPGTHARPHRHKGYPLGPGTRLGETVQAFRCSGTCWRAAGLPPPPNHCRSQPYRDP